MDGELPTILPELIMEIGPSSEPTSQSETKNPPSRKPPIDFHCRTFAFIGGEEPHFIFSTANEGWGRLYVTDKQIALAVEDGIKRMADLVRAGAGG